MSVLVGLIDQPVTQPESVGWETNKIGGSPTWLVTPTEPQLSTPSCRLCGGRQSLVAQFYCPLGGSAFHRCLYIFACPGKCSTQQQGWQVFRSMRYDATYDQAYGGRCSSSATQGKANMDVDSWGEGTDDWGDDADDWGDEADDWGDDGENNQDMNPHLTTTTAHHVLQCKKAEEIMASGPAAGEENVSAQAVLGTAQHSERENPGQGERDELVRLSDSSSASNVADCLAASFNAKVNVINGPEEHSTDNASDAELAVVSDTNTPQVLMEEMSLAGSERLDAMTRILNTKYAQMPPSGHSIPPEAVVLFKPYYLAVFEEPEEEQEVSDHVLGLIKDYEQSEGCTISSMLNLRPKSSKGKSDRKEDYEKSELRHGDRNFHKFLKRLQRCPHQCVRYDRDGEPLLMTKLKDQVIEPCPACGGDRVFELQLLPSLIPWLQTCDTDASKEIDFGTVLVFTCRNNCWPSGSGVKDPQLLKEVIVLQEDPDRHLYR